MQALLLRTLAILTGCALVCTRFLYEDEEKRIQSRLEDWWVNLAYRSDQAFSLEGRFLRALTDATARFLSKITGDRLLSVRSISVSLSCAIIPVLLMSSAGFLMVAWLPANDEAMKSDPFLHQAQLIFDGFPLYMKLLPLTLSLGLIAAVIVPAVSSRMRWLYVISAIVCLVLIADVLITLRGLDASLYNMALSVPVTVFCQLYAMAVTRRIMGRSAKSSSARLILMLLFLNIFTLLLLVIVPFTLKYLTDLALFGCIGFENMVSFAGVFSFVALGIVLLLHRCIWPIILRPLYFLQRFRILEHRNLLIGAGVSLLLGTFGTWGALWKNLGDLSLKVISQ
jgi:hypothetical protein